MNRRSRSLLVMLTLAGSACQTLPPSAAGPRHLDRTKESKVRNATSAENAAGGAK